MVDSQTGGLHSPANRPGVPGAAPRAAVDEDCPVPLLAKQFLMHSIWMRWLASFVAAPRHLAALAVLLALLAGCSTTAAVVPDPVTQAGQDAPAPDDGQPRVLVEGSWSLPQATPEDVRRVKQELLRRYALRSRQRGGPESSARQGLSEEVPSPVAKQAARGKQPARAAEEKRPRGADVAPPRSPATPNEVSPVRTGGTGLVARSNNPASSAPRAVVPAKKTAPAARGTTARVLPVAGELSQLKLRGVVEDAQGRRLALLHDGSATLTVRPGDRLLVPQGGSGEAALWQAETVGSGTLQLRHLESGRRVLVH